MSTWAILATGPSMSQELADAVHLRCGVIAVSDAFRLAPWADALVSNDMKWWRYHRDALKFEGRKFCGAKYPGTEHLPVTPHYGAGCNSGLQAMRAASEKFGATKILLLGFDMHGSHFFGIHPVPLKNTSPSRRKVHFAQFERFDQKKCRVVNCTIGSALTCFPFGDLGEELA